MTSILPDAARQFIEAAIVAGDMALPFHYPQPGQWEGWQSGFRHHGITGESLVGTAPGEWQPGWYVVALNGFGDPFFIDLNQEAKGFPVYYAPHGAGRWEAEQAAPSLQQLGDMLAVLRGLEDDATAAQHVVEAEASLGTRLWGEVLENRQNRADTAKEPASPPDTTAWQHGTLVICGIGPQKMKVVQFLKQTFGLSPQEALALAMQPEIAVAEGYLVHLRRSQDHLQALGATVEFRPHGPRA